MSHGWDVLVEWEVERASPGLLVLGSGRDAPEQPERLQQSLPFELPRLARMKSSQRDAWRQSFESPAPNEQSVQPLVVVCFDRVPVFQVSMRSWIPALPLRCPLGLRRQPRQRPSRSAGASFLPSSS